MVNPKNAPSPPTGPEFAAAELGNVARYFELVTAGLRCRCGECPACTVLLAAAANAQTKCPPASSHLPPRRRWSVENGVPDDDPLWTRDPVVAASIDAAYRSVLLDLTRGAVETACRQCEKAGIVIPEATMTAVREGLAALERASEAKSLERMQLAALDEQEGLEGPAPPEGRPDA